MLPTAVLPCSVVCWGVLWAEVGLLKLSGWTVTLSVAVMSVEASVNASLSMVLHYYYCLPSETTIYASSHGQHAPTSRNDVPSGDAACHCPWDASDAPSWGDMGGEQNSRRQGETVTRDSRATGAGCCCQGVALYSPTCGSPRSLKKACVVKSRIILWMLLLKLRSCA